VVVSISNLPPNRPKSGLPIDRGGQGINGWFDGVLILAKKIAAGEPLTWWKLPEKPEDIIDYAQHVKATIEQMPAVEGIAIPDAETMRKSIEANKEYVNQKLAALAIELHGGFALQASGIKIPEKLSKDKLHQKIEAYRQDRVQNYKGKYQGQLRVGKQIDAIKENIADCPIYEHFRRAIARIK